MANGRGSVGEAELAKNWGLEAILKGAGWKVNRVGSTQRAPRGRTMKIWNLVASALIFLSLNAHAQDKPTFQGMFDAVSHDPKCKSSEYPDFILMACEQELTFWYFTKPNNPAHPGIIKRSVIERNGAVYASEDGQSFGPDSAQPAFKAWMAQIVELDKEAREEMRVKQGQPQNPGNSK
jgi:hypothetical protein